MAKTEAWLSSSGQPQSVGEGAVAQQGTKKLYRCLTCGGPVVWLESKKTGKVYLASVYKGESTSYYISKPHDCAAKLAARLEREQYERDREAEREAQRAIRESYGTRIREHRTQLVAELVALETGPDGVVLDSEGFDHIVAQINLMTRLIDDDELAKKVGR